MPRKVLHLHLTQTRKDGHARAMEAIRRFGKLLGLYRQRSNSPRNGEGEVHSQLRRAINEAETAVQQDVEWASYMHEWDAHFPQVKVIKRRCR